MDRLVGRNEKNTSKMDVSKHLVEIMDDSFEMQINTIRVRVSTLFWLMTFFLYWKRIDLYVGMKGGFWPD